MYDGDEDNRNKPDVGAIFGTVADTLKDNPSVVPIAAQQKSWYYPDTEGGALKSAAGTLFETYVFPDDLPGSHAALTQSEALAFYPGYEQVFVGPAGPIAFNQLQDVNAKASGCSHDAGQLRVTVFQALINHELDQVLNDQLEAAKDDEAQAKIQAKIDQRATRPYGALFTPQGKLDFEPSQYPNLDIQVNRV